MYAIPSFHSYGKYRGEGYGLHTLCFEMPGSFGNAKVWFSYKTIVAFRTSETGLVVSENCWGPTTSKHLNWIDGGNAAKRLPRDKFKELLKKHFRR